MSQETLEINLDALRHTLARVAWKVQIGYDYVAKRTRPRGVVTMMRGGVVAMSVIAAAMVPAGCTDETTGSEETLTLTESDKGSRSAPIGNAKPAHDPPGTGFAFSIPLQDASTETVGEINAVCIATNPSPEPALNGTCAGTAEVPDGQLALSVGGNEIGVGAFVPPFAESDVTGAIVGGTGKYEGATGTFTSTSTDQGADDTFNITLP